MSKTAMSLIELQSQCSVATPWKNKTRFEMTARVKSANVDRFHSKFPPSTRSFNAQNSLLVRPITVLMLTKNRNWQTKFEVLYYRFVRKIRNSRFGKSCFFAAFVSLYTSKHIYKSKILLKHSCYRSFSDKHKTRFFEIGLLWVQWILCDSFKREYLYPLHTM